MTNKLKCMKYNFLLLLILSLNSCTPCYHPVIDDYVKYKVYIGDDIVFIPALSFEEINGILEIQEPYSCIFCSKIKGVHTHRISGNYRIEDYQ